MAIDSPSSNDPFNLNRFVVAQEPVYARVLSELENGQKHSHWMWYIFPQVDGLGFSATSKLYAIKSVDEARAYLNHPVLGPRLRECAQAVLAVEGRTASEIFGYPDDRKLKSCATLFTSVSNPGSVFERILQKHFDGERDVRTLQILDSLEGTKSQ